VSEADQNRAAQERTDRDAGRNASSAELALRLSSAPAEFLAGAVENPELTRREMLLLLRNRQAAPDVLRRIADDTTWLRYYELKRALALHPRTPLNVARKLVPYLYWKELVEVTTTPHVNPVVRRQAERILAARIDDLSEGERVALARRASRGVIGVLIASGVSRVLRSLLGNPRLIESDVARIAARSQAPPDVLAHLVGDPRWGCRRSVRLALIKNPRTPAQAALGALRGLSATDLRRLSRDIATPRIVRLGAERMLECGSRGPERSRSLRPGHG
jgi:hypothetical protein